jgi:hypothetical protein
MFNYLKSALHDFLFLDQVIILIALFWSLNILLLSEQFAQNIIP